MIKNQKKCSKHIPNIEIKKNGNHMWYISKGITPVKQTLWLSVTKLLNTTKGSIPSQKTIHPIIIVAKH